VPFTFFNKRITQNETKLFGSFSTSFGSLSSVSPQARYRAEDYITELLKKAAPQAHRHQIYQIYQIYQIIDF
jgi:N-acetylglutamate synthase-like GNAT family acetyltransferase